MKRYALAVAALLLPVGGAAIGQPGGGSTWGVTGPGMRANLARHHLVMMYGIPARYRSLIDPFPRRGPRSVAVPPSSSRTALPATG